MAILSKLVSLEHRVSLQYASMSFERLNLMKPRALPNKDVIALIIGIRTYGNIAVAANARGFVGA